MLDTEIKTGDIFLVKFHPGFGSELRKYRPAVIISEKITGIDQRFVLIAPLTTNTKLIHPQSELLVKGNPALETNSVLLCWYLWTIDSSRLMKKLGHLNTTETKHMRQKVSALLS